MFGIILIIIILQSIGGWAMDMVRECKKPENPSNDLRDQVEQLEDKVRILEDLIKKNGD